MKRPASCPLDPPPEMSVYRDRTAALLRRYLRMSLATGKVPQLLAPGGQIFRARVTSYRVHTFEDVVIFVHDVERCLARLPLHLQQVLGRVVLQEYAYDDAAALLGVSRRTLSRLVPVALDSLSEILLEAEVMAPFQFGKRPPQRCQDAKSAA